MSFKTDLRALLVNYEAPKTAGELIEDILRMPGLNYIDIDGKPLDSTSRKLMDEITDMPALGLLSTREMLQELESRGTFEHEAGRYAELGLEMSLGAKSLLERMPGSMLDYRTVVDQT